MVRSFLDQPVWVRVLRGLLLATLLTAGLLYTPTPYHLQAPGTAVVASTIISIPKERVYPVTGQLLMTTVLSEKASLMLCVYAMLDPAATLSKYGPGTVTEHAQSPKETSGQMELSQYLSTRVALEKLGYPVRGEYIGLRILGLNPESPNRGVLQPGDLIVELAGRKMVPLERFKTLLEEQAPGQTLKVVVKRKGRTLPPVDLGVAEIDGRMRIGAVLRPEYSTVELPVDVAFQSGNTSGASGGLVFALEIYDQLSPEDLCRGRTIAATGTLDYTGQVGGIEGITYKVISAERGGASIFLVPRDNWSDIKKAETSMKVIPIESFQDALDALQ